MSFIEKIIYNLPGVSEPQGHLSFKQRLKWTGIILLLFLILGQVTLFGITATAKERFQFFELILGSSMGSLMTLGIGPIVTASIILQLLVGSKIIPWDLKTHEGRKKFQGVQKLVVLFFCVFEAIAYTGFGAITPSSPDFFFIIIIQLAIGGFIVLLMDEVVSKWGIGSGVSLFIAAGVTKTIFVRAFNPLTPAGETVPAGLIPQFVVLLGIDPFQAFLAMLPLISTVIVFATVVYIQAMKIEIPLAFGSIRGFSRRWPLNLIYTSNIPVILIAALIANIQLFGQMAAKTVTEAGLKCGILGCFDQQGGAVSGVVHFISNPTSTSVHMFFIVLLLVIFTGAFLAFYFKYQKSMRVIVVSAIAGLILAFAVTGATLGLPTLDDTFRIFTYLIVLTLGSVIFSIFWVSTSGMDSRSVAEQIESMGMQIPGFRRDPRIVEQVLERYIPTLAIISGLFIGILAAMADFTGALGTGTGILLTVMIIYNLYENIATRYMEDMHPALRKFFR